MTEQPLVSVIINCYNSEKYLRETIDSLIAQTYTNWEAIFWDNCSIDKTAEIINSYGDPRFRYFLAEKNTPLGEARNLAMEKVQGEYLCFLDSDDVWEESFLSEGINALGNHQDIVAFYSNYLIWTESEKKPYNNGLQQGRHSFKTILRTYGIGMSACIVRTAVIKDSKIGFDNRYQLIEDLDFFLKVAMKGDFVYSNDNLCLYRVHSSSSSYMLKDCWYVEYGMLYEDLVSRCVSIKDPLADKNDLGRIKKLRLLYESMYYKSHGMRRELIRLLANNPLYIIEKPIFLVYSILGSNLYKNLGRLASCHHS